MFDQQFLSGGPPRKVGFKGRIQAEHVVSIARLGLFPHFRQFLRE